MAKENISTSMFYMWRVIIAIAHADGKVSAEEKAYFQKVFAGMERVYSLTPEQKATFADDLVNAQKISDLMRYINDPAIRGQLIYFAGLLARTDGVLSPDEDTIIKKLHADQMASLDMEQIRKDVRAAVSNEMFQHDIAKSMLRPQSGIGAVIDELLLRLGIDIYS